MRDPIPAFDHVAACNARRMDLVDQAIKPLPANIHAHLAPDAFESAWSAGQKLTVEEALALTHSEVGY